MMTARLQSWLMRAYSGKNQAICDAGVTSVITGVTPVITGLDVSHRQRGRVSTRFSIAKLKGGPQSPRECGPGGIISCRPA
jgi:hypothetical protein